MAWTTALDQLLEARSLPHLPHTRQRQTSRVTGSRESDRILVLAVSPASRETNIFNGQTFPALVLVDWANIAAIASARPVSYCTTDISIDAVPVTRFRWGKSP
jgi:hypothetical protein